MSNLSPIIYIPGQTSVEALDKLPAGYQLTGKSSSDSGTGMKVWQAVKCGRGEDIGVCIRKAEQELIAMTGDQNAPYNHFKKSTNAEIRRIQEGRPEPPPHYTSPAGMRAKGVPDAIAQEAGMFRAYGGKQYYYSAAAVLWVAAMGAGLYWWMSRR